MDVLMWTRDMQEARNIAFDVATEYARLFRATDVPQAGLMEWLQALQASRVPVALVSNLDRYAWSPPRPVHPLGMQPCAALQS